MSCYEWEKGEWKLSCVEYRKLRDALIKGYNELNEKNYNNTLRVKEEFDRIKKDKAQLKIILDANFCNNYNSPDADRVLLRVICDKISKNLDDEVVRRAILLDKKEVMVGRTNPPLADVDQWVETQNKTCYKGTGRRVDAQGQIWGIQWVDRKTTKLPKKKDFHKATTATTSFSVSGGEAYIQLDADTRTVTWEVSENNHAIEYANDDPMARIFWAALGQVNWTRGTGGRLWGSNEYDRDAERDNGYSRDLTKKTW